jgi:hypothetical protein
MFNTHRIRVHPLQGEDERSFYDLSVSPPSTFVCSSVLLFCCSIPPFCVLYFLNSAAVYIADTALQCVLL